MLSEYIKDHKEGKWAFSFAPSVQEKHKKYTYWERVKYTHKRGWFVKQHYWGLIWLPCVATNFDIYVDLIRRDIEQKKRIKQLKTN